MALVKMRQRDGESGLTPDPDGPEARGILNPEAIPRAFDLRLFQPHAELRPWVEFYWAVRWDLGTDTFAQTVVSNPTVDLSFEDDAETNGPGLKLVATGVPPKSYVRVLRGRAEVFAVHFHAGMFRPWWGAGVAALSGRAEHIGPRTATQAWQRDALALLPRVIDAANDERVRMLDALLLDHRPAQDAVAERVRDLVRAARHDRTFWDPKILAQRIHVSQRTSQRVFLDYVGQGPKWVARRYRIQAAVEALDAERIDPTASRRDLTALALDLGYYDLAHFSRDFRDVTGYAPSDYRARR
jgi:AraC-like DNA-binding protein